MRALFSLLFICFISISLNAQDFKFESETIDYGQIEKNANGSRIFVFTNIGDQPLIINKIQSSCGCTVPKKPTQPIMPGEKGEIQVSYDTKRIGGFSKTITVFSNSKSGVKRIKIKGYISKPNTMPVREKSLLSN